MIDEWGALLPGQRIAGYEIKRKLGQGGFGIAYEAFSEDLGVRAAIKEFFPRELVGRSGSTVTVREGEFREFYGRFLNRFVEEARTLHTLDHGNIVKVKHFERANNTAYVVMDFIDGANLKAWLDARRGAIGEAELRRIFEPIMDALSYVHAQNILHRDLSPLNIMVDRTGKPWLIDFGAFKSMWKEQPRRTTVLAANPSYAPPEQVDEMAGQEHGPFTDVYALAATMYEAVSGRRPVPAVSRTTALAYGRPDPLTPLAELPTIEASRALMTAIMRGLVVDPRRRTQTVAALKADAGWEQSAASGAAGGRASEPEAKPERSVVSKTSPIGEAARVTPSGGAGKTAGDDVEVAEAASRRGGGWLALAWLVLAALATLGLGIVFQVLKWRIVDRLEGGLATGFVAGTIASVVVAVVLSLKRRPHRTSTELAVYWLGSAAIIGLCVWPVLDVVWGIRHPTSSGLGLAAFLIGGVAYLAYRNRV